MSSVVNGLASRNIAPPSVASSTISLVLSEVTKPKGISKPLGVQRREELDARHLGHVPVREDQVRLFAP